MKLIQREKVLLKPEEIVPSSPHFEVLGVLNPATVRMPNGKIFMYVRVIEKLKVIEDDDYFYAPRMAGRNEFKLVIDKFKKDDVEDNGELDIAFKNGTKRITFISHFRKVMIAADGFTVLSVDKKPTFYGLSSNGELGVEDPRITYINGKYVMSYVSLSRKQNVSVSLAISKDLKKWTRKGIIFGQQDKDVVIFPEKVRGNYIALDRPEGTFQFTQPTIWIGYSKNLVSWGNLKALDCLHEKNGSCPRNGAGPPPIKTEDGWLLFYHIVTNLEPTKKEKKQLESLKKYYHIEVDDLEKVPVYSVGCALLDLDDPEKVIANTGQILLPTKKYEMGTFEKKGVLFPTGLVPTQDGKSYLLYSGAGDRVATVKKLSIKEIMRLLKRV